MKYHHQIHTQNHRAQNILEVKGLILNEHSTTKDFSLSIQADEANILQSTNSIISKAVICKIHHDGRSVAEITAQTSNIDRSNKIILLQDSVQGKWQGINIHGNDVAYNYSQQQISTTRPATYSHNLFSLQANESFADLKEEKIIFSGEVFSEFFISHDSQQDL